MGHSISYPESLGSLASGWSPEETLGNSKNCNFFIGCPVTGLIYLGVTCEVFLCVVTIMFVLSIVLTSLFSLFHIPREGNRFLHRG